MAFRTMYTAHDRFYNSAGDRLRQLYNAEFDREGNLQLVEAGTEDTYDFIQSHADSVDINIILKRFAAGEVDVMSRAQGVYGDFTNMPSTYADMLNVVIAGERAFNDLPIETRAQFDHSYQKWLVAMDSPDFAERMGLTVKPGDDPTAAAVSAEPGSAVLPASSSD